MKKFVCITLILLFSVSSLLADVAKYKATYEKKMGEYAVAHGMSKTDYAGKYLKALEALKKQVQAKGDLEQTRAAIKEIARFKKSKVVPGKPSEVKSIANLQNNYKKSLSILDAKMASQVVDLTSKYDLALQKLQKTLVSKEKIDDAVAVKAERDRVVKSAKYLNAVNVIKAYRKASSSAGKTHAAAAQPKPISKYKNMKLVMYNTHNGHNADRGSLECDIELKYRGKSVWSKTGHSLKWDRAKNSENIVNLPDRMFDQVRVTVTKWYRYGGGFQEIKVLRGTQNLALKQSAEASLIYDKRFPASAVNDGIIKYGDKAKGWLLPNYKSGWVEVRIRKPL